MRQSRLQGAERPDAWSKMRPPHSSRGAPSVLPGTLPRPPHQPPEGLPLPELVHSSYRPSHSQSTHSCGSWRGPYKVPISPTLTSAPVKTRQHPAICGPALASPPLSSSRVAFHPATSCLMARPPACLRHIPMRPPPCHSTCCSRGRGHVEEDSSPVFGREHKA